MAVEPGILPEQQGLSVVELYPDRGMEERSSDGVVIER
jgi:hypothetical protein